MIDYENYALGYDERYTSESSEAENQMIKGLLSWYGIDKRKKFLDLGCGTGFFLDMFKVEDYVGVDVSTGMVSQAKLKHPDKKFFAIKAGECFGSYDTVISLFSMPYIGIDGVRAAYRCLEKGGLFVCVHYEKPYKSPDSVYYRKPLKYKLTVAPKMADVLFECKKLFKTEATDMIGEGYRLTIYRKVD